MKILLLLIILFFIFFKKIIEGNVINTFKYPKLEDLNLHPSKLHKGSYDYIVSPYLEQQEYNFLMPPSSIGEGVICPVSPILIDKLPPCMNGNYCETKDYPEFEEVGRCRRNRLVSKVFF